MPTICATVSMAMARGLKDICCGEFANIYYGDEMVTLDNGNLICCLIDKWNSTCSN